MSFKSLTALVLFGLSVPAFGHHPLQGQPMETFTHGLLSGIGHPLLGFDHLFFIVAMGMVAALCRPRALLITAFLVAMAAGCLLRSSMAEMLLHEAIIAGSLLIVGGMLALARIPGWSITASLFTLFGLFHGAAFGAAIAAEEAASGQAVILGYLSGLVVAQALIAWLAGSTGKLRLGDTGVRLAGAMVAGAGLFLLLEASEPLFLNLVT